MTQYEVKVWYSVQGYLDKGTTSHTRGEPLLLFSCEKVSEEKLLLHLSQFKIEGRQINRLSVKKINPK